MVWVKSLEMLTVECMNCSLTYFRAGMIQGDIVVEINGVKVNASEEIYQAVQNSNSITMVVQRGHKLLRMQMTPEFTE